MVIRTEASHAQGMGDLAGSLAIAGEFDRQTVDVHFLVEAHPPALQLLSASAERFQALPSGTDVASDVAATLALEPDIVIVNRLRSPAEYVRLVRERGSHVVTIDDDGEAAKWADLRINPLYPVANALTSFEYLMLSQRFRNLRPKRRTVRKTVRRMLVLQGGADTYGFLPAIVDALHAVRGAFDVTVVAGPAFRHDEELQRSVAAGPRHVVVARDPANLPELMLEADLAITAGGLTMFELAALGTPALVVCGERFEVPTAKRMEEGGAVICLGFGADLSSGEMASAVEQLISDPTRRRQMAAAGRRMVDGKGAARIAARIVKLGRPAAAAQ